MNIVFFPDQPWESFAHRHMANWLAPLGAVYAAYPAGGTAPADNVRIISYREAAEMAAEDSAAFVAHPYAPTVVSIFRYPITVALHVEAPEGASARWYEHAKRLKAEADFIITDSERVYAELLFQYESVLIIGSPRESTDAAWPARDGEALLDALALCRDGKAIDFVMRRQWDEQLRYYERLAGLDDSQELVWYLQSFYRYLLGETDEAAASLQQCYAACLLASKPDALASRFRFLAAIRLRGGELEQALDAYGITCTTEEDRARYERLLRLYGQGEKALVRGELLLNVGDARSARRLLAASAHPDARRQLRSAAASAGDLRAILGTYGEDPIEAANWRELAERELLLGQLTLTEGDRRGAMRSFWRAAAHTGSYRDLLELGDIDRELARVHPAVKALV
ncbi:tetratricopeptide repeat protein [Paenibacillus xanthanilyticus]|uniref:Tetratricopeptide repeat protein n=1 Tax=Paenibacillus xanthanilyticus TaxID=1783531 RepID=A0ABV8K1P3_9BACL